VRVLFLNLTRRADRNQRFLDVNRGCADFQRFEAIDGAHLETEQLIQEGVIREPLREYTPGALGCAVSHKTLWEYCVSSGEPVAIAEDDGVFNRHFAEKAGKVLADLPPGWDIILWGWNFDSVLHVEAIPGVKQAVMEFDPRELGPHLSKFQNCHYDVAAVPLIAAFGLVCYSVSPKGAQRLGELCFPLRNEEIPIHAMRRRLLNVSIDVTMNKHYRGLDSYVSFPPLVWTDNDKSTSDVSPAP
jgi:glycosyl transferase family 25